MVEEDENTLEKLDPTDPAVIKEIERATRYYLHQINLPLENAEDDIKQNVLMELVKMEKSPEHPKAYLSAIVRNQALNYLKKSNYYNQIQLDDEDSEAFHLLADKKVEHPSYDTKILLSEFWKTLNSDEQTTLHSLIFGYSQKELAYLLNISHESARKRVSRLKEKLKNFLFSEE